ncbi:MAG: ribonuclease P protein component 2 [Candidatus Nanohaloarchaeota archaeon QJJ-7]|nr:ribonuclease P protein component 2 [Candidatus Nanohaloarchaeota archaeon QJJ-7]
MWRWSRISEKLQTLPSSLREKKRYIVFEIICRKDRELGQVLDAVWDSVLDFLGQEGTAKADPWIIEGMFNEEEQKGAVKVKKDYVEEVRAALALVQEIGGEEAALQILGVTGTMDSAREKYL